MKMRSLAMLVTTSMLTAAFIAYVAPAFAEDDNTTQTMQAPTDNNSENQNNDMSNPSANNMSNPSANMMNPSSPSSSSTDQATPDTATGDDDY